MESTRHYSKSESQLSLEISRTKTGLLIPVSLIGMSFIPIVAGIARLAGLASEEKVTSQNARFVDSPLPVSVHIISASLFCMIGAFQFWPQFRKHSPRWHRIAGRILVPSGIIAAFSGLWMNQFYPYAAKDGFLLYCIRLLFGTGMLFCLIFGIGSVLRHDLHRHRSWMMRGYAIGLGAGTQAVTQLPLILTVGPPEEMPRALLMGGAWIINLLFAEWILQRPG